MSSFTKQAIAIDDGEVTLYTPTDPEMFTKYLFEYLYINTDWQRQSVVIYGKSIPQPRLVSWYSDCSYTYSGLTLPPNPMPPVIQTIRDDIQDLTMAPFNSVLLNLYTDGSQYIGFHADDEPELGPNPCIASLSLGESRTLIFKHKDKKYQDVRVPLHHGDVLVMERDTQRHWKHGIPKTSRKLGPRINLTFRNIVS